MADYNLGTAHGVIEISSNTRGIDQAQRGLGGLQTQSRNVEQSLNKTANVSAGVGVAIAGGLGVAVKTAMDFDKQLSAIAAVGGAEAKASMDEIRATALRIGADTTFSAGEAAAAMEELVKAGIPVKDVLNGAADATVALAAAGGVDLPTAASLASNAMNQFGLKADDLVGVTDTIAQTANASAIDVTDLGMAMSQVGAVANLAGLNFDDTAIAIGELGDAGIKGSDAGTSLKTMLMNLQPSTEKQIGLFEELGILTEDGTNKFYDQTGALRPLAEIQGVLKGALDGMTQAQKQAALETMFGSDAIRAGAVLAENGAVGYQEFADKMQNVGSAADVAKTRQDNLAGSVEALKGSVETLGIQVGTALTPLIRGLADALSVVVNWFSTLSPSTQSWIVGILAASAGLLLLTAGILKTVLMFRSMIQTMQTLRILSTATQAGFIRTAAVAVLNFTKMAVSASINALKTAASWTAAAVKIVAQWVWMGIQATIQAAKQAAVWTAQVVASAARGAASFAIQVARVVAGWVIMGVQSLIQAARMAAAWLIAMGPVGWVIAAVIALVALIIANWDKVKKWTAAAWEWVVGKIVAVWNGVKSAVSNGVSAVINFVSQLPAKIKNFFAGAGQWLLDAGRSLLQGLWNGISGAAGWLWDQITNFLGNIVDNVTSFFGIGSPSKLFEEEIGKWLPAGLAVGIEANAGDAMDAADALSNAVMGSVSMSQGGPDTFWDGRGTGPGYVPPSREVASYSDAQGVAPAGGHEVKYEFNTYNPVAERASDSNARRLRGLASLGAFGGDD